MDSSSNVEETNNKIIDSTLIEQQQQQVNKEEEKVVVTEEKKEEITEEKEKAIDEPETKKPKLTYEEKKELKKARLAEKWNSRKWGREDKEYAAKKREERERKLAEKQANGDNNNGDGDENANDEERRYPKRKVALIFGYSGEGYLGLQVNGRMKTIERDLEDAICAAGGISKENAGSFQKVRWSRCARTDKGVSAAANVVGFNMLLVPSGTTVPSTEAEEEEAACAMVRRINAALPAQIRVYGVRRVTGGFCAKQRCNARTYQYVVPTFALVPGGYREDVDAAEQLRKVDVQYLRALMQNFLGTKNYHNFTVRRPAWDKSCMRHMISMDVSEPKVIDGLEVVTFTVHGQSFMLLQIRKMIGFMLILARTAPALEDAKRIFDEAFQRDKIGIPAAPALGLYLDHPHYDFYNKSFTRPVIQKKMSPEERQAEEAAAALAADPAAFRGRQWVRGPIRTDDWKDEVEAFKDSVILPHIIGVEKAEGTMKKWIAVMELRLSLGYIKVTPNGLVTPALPPAERQKDFCDDENNEDVPASNHSNNNDD